MTARGIDKLERWLAVTGSDLRTEKTKGLAKAVDVSKELLLWPGEVQRIQKEGDAWRVKDDDWMLILEVRPFGDTPPVKVLLAQEQTFLGDGHHWVHQAE